KSIFSDEGFIGKMINNIKSIFSDEGSIGKIIKNIKNALSDEGAIGDLVKSFKNIFSKESFIGKIINVFTGVGEEAGGIIKFIEPILTIFKPLKLVFTKLLSFLSAPVLAAIEVVINTVESVLDQGLSFKSILDGVVGGLLSFFTLGFVNFKDVKDITDKVISSFKKGDFWSVIVDVVSLVPELLIKGWGLLVSKITGWLGFDEVSKTIESYFKDFSFTKMWEDIFSKIDLQNLFDITNDIVDWFKGLFKDFNLDDLLKPVTDTINSIITLLDGVFKDFNLDDLLEPVYSGIDSVVTWFKDLLSKLNFTDAFSIATSKVTDFLKDFDPMKVVDDIVDQIKKIFGLIGEVFGKAKEFVSKGVEKLKFWKKDKKDEQ
ncbi:MAG: hypothetical protein EBU90_31115, partial [Proteobacteria bacterium]|nr:hypothetical protein [Pseudomonadota bacterium]